MTRTLLVAVMLAALIVLPFGEASAEDGVILSRTSSLIGEHIVMEIRITAPQGATVELTPGTPSWSGIELVSVEDVTQAPSSDGTLWFIQAKVAAFLPGTVEFAPSVVVVQGAEATPFTLPAVRFTALPTLAPDAELVLSPLDDPTAIPGAESRLLMPAVVGGAGLGLALVAAVSWFLARFVLRRLRPLEPAVSLLAVPQSLEGAEQLLHIDPVGAYRLMSLVVKTELARRYGVRATALTTTELRRKLESGGDRWQARLVGGLLEECDSVIYAGYRPATERREADLTMAREIIEVAS